MAPLLEELILSCYDVSHGHPRVIVSFSRVAVLLAARLRLRVRLLLILLLNLQLLLLLDELFSFGFLLAHLLLFLSL